MTGSRENLNSLQIMRRSGLASGLAIFLRSCGEPGRVRLSWNEVYKVNNLQKFVVDDPHFIDDSSVEAHNSSKSLQNSSTALLVKSYDRVMDCLETPFDCFSDLF